MRIGSLFSGAGGLDMAVEAVFGGTTVWHCELDPAAAKVLAHHWPGVPNLGDITEIDFGSVAVHGVGWDFEPVDILCGGYPCQPFSAAGQRKGHNDERHLWPYFAEAIRHLRPRYVVLENVAGHRSMGFDSVLADLADIGYDTQWCSVRASDVGAPHRRERLFVVAHPDNRTRDREWPRTESRLGSTAAADAAHGDRRLQHGNRGSTSDGGDAYRQVQNSREIPCTEPARLERGSDAAPSGAGPVELLPTPQAEIVSSRMDTRLSGDGREAPDKLGWAIAELLPTPKANDGTGGCYNSAGHQDTLPGTVRLLPTPRSSDCFGPGLHGDGGLDLRTTVTLLPTPVSSDGNDGGGPDPVKDDVLAQTVKGINRWGKYEPAIRRWEALTRPAPPPTEPNTKGNPRLSAAFSEWMLGWPAGWVTAVPGISRNDALRIIGNGVVPAQAGAALRWLLSVSELAA